MRFLIRRFFLAGIVAVVVSGCGGSESDKVEGDALGGNYSEELDLPEPSGGFVLSVGDETITSAEVVRPLIRHLKRFAEGVTLEEFSRGVRADVEKLIITRVSDILVYQKAKAESPSEFDGALAKAADSEIRQFLMKFGGDYAKAEAALKEMGMDWISFKEQKKKAILSYSYMLEQIPEIEPVTYNELLEVYNKVKGEVFSTPERIRFRLIDIQPALIKVQDVNQTRQEQARALADELLERIDSGEDFGMLVQQYSQGPMQAQGGLWKSLEPNSLAVPYDVLGSSASTMKTGEIAGPIEVEGHIFIMKLEEKQAGYVEPFEQVQKQIEQKIIRARREKAIYDFRVKFVKQAALGNVDRFVGFCVERLYKACMQEVD
ncbi:MAG: peptidyl-prolyl cis-trans isomerase [Sedimentisphaerales bacterium]|nr:peptidyl-prolyl cis-trans isomerase [Sedimentisphaerales bacterium]